VSLFRFKQFFLTQNAIRRFGKSTSIGLWAADGFAKPWHGLLPLMVKGFKLRIGRRFGGWAHNRFVCEQVNFELKIVIITFSRRSGKQRNTPVIYTVVPVILIWTVFDNSGRYGITSSHLWNSTVEGSQGTKFFPSFISIDWSFSCIYLYAIMLTRLFVSLFSNMSVKSRQPTCGIWWMM
jgi:hypothetical protein